MATAPRERALAWEGRDSQDRPSKVETRTAGEGGEGSTGHKAGAGKGLHP